MQRAPLCPNPTGASCVILSWYAMDLFAMAPPNEDPLIVAPIHSSGQKSVRRAGRFVASRVGDLGTIEEGARQLCAAE